METLTSKIMAQGSVRMGVSKSCPKHGDYMSIMITGRESQCPKCVDELLKSEYKRDVAKTATENISAKANVVFSRAAIPPRFTGRTLENYQPTCDEAKKALEVAKCYANEFEGVLANGRNLMFVGSVGSGKTHLATGIANQVMTQGYSALFASVISAVRKVKETYRRDAEQSEANAIKSLIDPDLLILDEVGVQFGTDAEKIILFEIINGRYEHMKPTILISNLGLDGLGEYLGDRVIDRLREGGGKAVIFNWPSYRRSA
jgi:DNA replication protein DnaC